jgi:dimethylhistidine N-methyltransferase
MNQQFLLDVLKGLTAPNKFLESKYFYNAKGDAIFQKIMDCPEYYPTRCEMEILTQQACCIAKAFTANHAEFDLIELGPGDASKSIHLLQELLKQDISFTYYPIDISANVIEQLEKKLPEQLPGIKLKGLNGDYFSMLKQTKMLSQQIKVVLFMGGNIGNIQLDKVSFFCKQIREQLSPEDLLLVGFDLKKHPQLILNAYNDTQGFTQDFNLNLLARINEELEGDFIIENFLHFPTYDPAKGACKSYLISKKEQTVHVGEKTIQFTEFEPIFMEIAQKYTVKQTDELAISSGFKPINYFYDSKKWFLDVLWQCV